MKLPFREAPPFRAGSFTIDTLKRDALGCYEADKESRVGRYIF
jgi:hypothetical protein